MPYIVHGTQLSTLILMKKWADKTQQLALIPAGTLRKQYGIPVLAGEKLTGLFGMISPFFRSRRRTGVNYGHISAYRCYLEGDIVKKIGYASSDDKSKSDLLKERVTAVENKLDYLVSAFSELQAYFDSFEDAEDNRAGTAILGSMIKKCEYELLTVLTYRNLLEMDEQHFDFQEKINRAMEAVNALSTDDSLKALAIKYFGKMLEHLTQVVPLTFTDEERGIINHDKGIALIFSDQNLSVADFGDLPDEVRVKGNIPMSQLTGIVVRRLEDLPIVYELLKELGLESERLNKLVIRISGEEIVSPSNSAVAVKYPKHLDDEIIDDKIDPPDDINRFRKKY